MIPTENQEEIEFPSIFTADGRTPNACVLLEDECFGIAGGSYLLIDTNIPYIDGKLSVLFLDSELKLLRVNSVNDVFLFTSENFSLFLNLDELTERVKWGGIVLQALIDVNAKFSSERFHA